MNFQALPKHRPVIKHCAFGLSRRHILFDDPLQHRINGGGDVLFQVGDVEGDLQVQHLQLPDIRSGGAFIDGHTWFGLGG
ncbi:hypothetical protein D3C73_1479410 [compost metagenome]